MQQPGRRAFIFLPDGETEEFPVTYGALDRRSRAIAAMLQREAGAAERAILLCPPGLDYIAALFGCLYAAVAAVPACPPDPADPERILPRLRAIAYDAAPAVIVTTNAVLAEAADVMAKEPAFSTASWLTADAITDAEVAQWREPVIDGDTAALLQYTSGASGAPKGVMISHRNLMHSEALIQRVFSATEESVCVSWLPLHHNMGLIGTVLQAVYTGFPCTFMAPGDFLQKPVRWLRAITRYGATLSGGPNFAYDLCVSKVTPEQRAGLDLRGWDVAFNGAEPVRPDTLEGFAAAFRPYGFRREAFFSCYGLTEATWMVSGGPVATPPDPSLAPAVGGPIPPGQVMLIVDPKTRTRCEDGEIGEVWVTGPGVAAGYRNTPQATNETFNAALADSDEGRFLRTGDLGFVNDRQLFVTGRRQTAGDGFGAPVPDEREGEEGTADQIALALLDMEPARRLALLATYLRQQVARVLAVPPAEVSEDRPFMALGLNSLGVLGLKQRIEDDLGVAVPLDHLIDYPTIARLAAWIQDTLEQSIGALLTEVDQLTDEEVELRLKQFTAKEQ